MPKAALALAVAGTLVAASHTVLAEESCSGSGTPMTVEAVKAKLALDGYTQIKDIRSHQGCYEAKGFDSAGKRFEIEVNAYTGTIVNKE